MKKKWAKGLKTRRTKLKVKILTKIEPHTTKQPSENLRFSFLPSELLATTRAKKVAPLTNEYGKDKSHT